MIVFNNTLALSQCRQLCVLHIVTQIILVNIELWNEEYRDGIKTRGDKIGMILCIIKPLNDVRQKFSANHYGYW